MFMFGGTFSNKDKHYFYSLDLKNYKWEIIFSRGEVPLQRDEHSANFYDSSMVIFGGFVAGERVRDMYRYYFKDNKWEKV